MRSADRQYQPIAEPFIVDPSLPAWLPQLVDQVPPVVALRPAAQQFLAFAPEPIAAPPVVPELAEQPTYPAWLARHPSTVARQAFWAGPITVATAPDLAWQPDYPDWLPATRGVRDQAFAADPFPVVVLPDLAWRPGYPDWLSPPRGLRAALQQAHAAPVEPIAVTLIEDLRWLARYPDWVWRPGYPVSAQLAYAANLLPILLPSFGVPQGIVFPIAERATGRYRAQLVGHDGVTPLTNVHLLTLTLTLYAVSQTDADTIVNTRQRQDVLNLNDVTVTPSGLLTWIVQPGDTTLVDPAVPFERHIALFEYTWLGGAGKHEVLLVVRNLRRVS